MFNIVHIYEVEKKHVKLRFKSIYHTLVNVL